jgi:hypothetical protein
MRIVSLAVLADRSIPGWATGNLDTLATEIHQARSPKPSDELQSATENAPAALALP